ncbi:MAG: YjbQ family protein [Phycisphaera sp.]|nr:YjbQ family protein [Phycisphaera sp.]
MQQHGFEVRTHKRSEMVEVTDRVQALLSRSQVGVARVTVFVPHTTAGITINENADPDVVHDMLEQLDRMVPWDQPFFRHNEGNSAAHVKASMMGSSVTLLADSGTLRLGTWQGVYLCEYDGPRTRKVWVHVEW